MTSVTMHPENVAARRNVLLYVICQSFSGSAAPISIALGAVVGSYLLGPDKSLATVPVTSFNIGVAFGAFLANMIMRQIGRKRGFMSGTVIGMTGMLMAGHAIILHNFWYFAAAMIINGVSGGFTQQYRFAAADRGTADFKPKAISWILAGGVISAIVGPQAIILTTNLTDPIPFAGSFFFAISFFVLSFVALAFLRPSNLALNQEEEAPKPGRPLAEIARQPKFMVALLCGTATYALMSFVMTGAPLAMIGCGYSVELSTLGIQWHVLAMFGPSFFTGHLITRYGKETIIATGLLLLMVCGVIAVMGIELMHFWGSLILLGLGWNFGFIGSTSLLTETYRPEEKNAAQGLNDVVLFGTVAAASLMSGLALNAYGWNFLNYTIFPISLICLLSLAWLHTKNRQLVE